MINEYRLVELFKSLCLINAPSLQEADCSAFVKKHLEDMGLEVFEDNAAQQMGGNSNNVIAWLRGDLPDAPKIMLSAHLDTVEPTEGLVIEEVDGVFRSASDTILGADDKGGMAPIIEAVQCIKDSGESHGDICMVFTIGEEIGLIGAKAAPIEDLHLDFGFVLDTGPPVGSFVNRTATHDKMTVVIHGLPAHSGKDPEKGISAIQVAADAIHGMKLGRIGPETTANIGIIEGGTAVNVVCPKVKIRAEARSTDVTELDAQIDHMISKFEEAATKWGARVEIEHDRHYSAYHVPADSQVVQVGQRASRTLGFDPVLRTTLGGSDANVYNKRNLPCIVVATGMDKIHTHDEFISREDLVKTAELVVELIRESAKERRFPSSSV